MKKFRNYVIALALIITVFFLVPGIRPMIVMSGSMEPVMPTGSLCFVNTHCDFSDVKTNDIITYTVMDAKITHRAVKINKEEGYLVTKGDNNESEDIGVVNRENYYGKVMVHIPYMGYALFFIKKHMVTILLLILALVKIREKGGLKRI